MFEEVEVPMELVLGYGTLLDPVNPIAICIAQITKQTFKLKYKAREDHEINQYPQYAASFFILQLYSLIWHRVYS